MNLDPNRACSGRTRRIGLDDRGEGEHTPRRVLGRRLALPIFAGDNAYRWVIKVEMYFQINGVEDDEKLELSLVAKEGEA